MTWPVAVHAACMLCAALALVLAGLSLRDTVTREEPRAPESVADLATLSAPGPDGVIAAAKENGAWPTLFGAIPQAPQDVAPPPPLPVTYVLKGLVASEEMRWAILTAGADDHLVREGDVISDDVEVVAIGPEGVWLRFADRRHLVAFEAAQPVRIASVEVGSGNGDVVISSGRQDVRTQSLTPIQLRDIILKAEADRIEKGLVPPGAEDG